MKLPSQEVLEGAWRANEHRLRAQYPCLEGARPKYLVPEHWERCRCINCDYILALHPPLTRR